MSKQPKTETVSPSELVTGDTVVINGVERTLGRGDVKSSLMGTLVCGERCIEGVQRVLYPRWKAGVFTGYSPR